MRVRMAAAMMDVPKMPMVMLVRGFGRIAGRDNRSVIVLVHLEIFYAFTGRRAAESQSYYAV